jgi:hypothetical protein
MVITDEPIFGLVLRWPTFDYSDPDSVKYLRLTISDKRALDLTQFSLTGVGYGS